MTENDAPEGVLVLERPVANAIGVFVTNSILAALGLFLFRLLAFSYSGIEGMGTFMTVTMLPFEAYFIYVAARMLMRRRTHVAIEDGRLVVDGAVRAPAFLGKKESYELSSLRKELQEARKTTTYWAFLVLMLFGPLIRIMVTGFDKKLPRYIVIKDSAGKKALELREDFLKAFGYEKAVEWLAARGFAVARMKS
jgi:hypothetical protein